MKKRSEPSPFSVKIIKKANYREILELYIEAGWIGPHDQVGMAHIRDIVKQSFCFVAAFQKGKIIGFGRAIADGVSDAYIQDVYVSAKFRHKGIGGEIVKSLVDYLEKRRIEWMGLIAQPGTRHFYERYGFRVMVRHLSMLRRKKR